MRKLILLISILLPWPLKRRLLNRLTGFEIDKSARIGWSWLGMKRLEMAAGSRIGHLNVFKQLDLVRLDQNSTIGRFNLITCIPTSNKLHYQHINNRQTVLQLGEHSDITMWHIIDCNAPIIVGRFTTIAGYCSQFLTHSIDLRICRQDAESIIIGDYCFVGTSCTILGGSKLPDYSVLSAKSLLRTQFKATHSLFAGVPAIAKKQLPDDTKYWVRNIGFVE